VFAPDCPFTIKAYRPSGVTATARAGKPTSMVSRTVWVCGSISEMLFPLAFAVKTAGTGVAVTVPWPVVAELVCATGEGVVCATTDGDTPADGDAWAAADGEAPATVDGEAAATTEGEAWDTAEGVNCAPLVGAA
jgi:hypothetical protein